MFLFLVKTTVESRETDYAAQCCSFSYIYLARHYWAGTSNLFLQFPFTLYKEDCQIFFYWKSNGQIKQKQLQPSVLHFSNDDKTCFCLICITYPERLKRFSLQQLLKVYLCPTLCIFLTFQRFIMS